MTHDTLAASTRHRCAVLVVAALIIAAAALVPRAAVADQSYVVPPTRVWSVNGAGFGHGIGMSQWGAQGAALAGLRPDQILSFYYPGTTFGYVANPPIRVQLRSYAGTAIVFGAYGSEQLTATDLATGSSQVLPASDRYLLTLDSTYMYLSVRTPAGWSTPQAFIGPIDINGPSGTWLYSPDLSGAGTQYWGTLRLVRTNPAAAQAVNVVSLDAYAKFVVPREVPAWWHESALQAQAVAARSYAMAVSNPAGLWDICDTTACQVYGGRAIVSPGGAITWLESASTSSAVEATSGLVLADGSNRPAFTQFSSSSGGYTVAGSRPYLVAQPDPYSGLAPGDPVSRWKAQLAASTLQQSCPSGGMLNSFDITGRDGRGPFGGRITSVRLNCSTGAVTITGSGSLGFGMRSNMWEPSVAPFGNLELLTGNAGGIHAAGWAIAPDGSTAQVAIVSDTGSSITIDADRYRADVGAAYPSDGPMHGFDVTVPAPPGAPRVCVYAIASGSRALLGCAGVEVPAGGPFGHVDSVRGVPATSSDPPGILVSGWVIDPDTSAPIDVHIYRSGSSTPAVVTASQSRPDVGAAYPASGAAHGFTARISAPAGFSGKACAYAINVPAPSANPVLGCEPFAVPGGNPIGNSEVVTTNAGGVHVSGWALDPDTTVPSDVRVTVDGNRWFLLSANQLRSDVAAVYPDYGGAHGYVVLLPTGSGAHTVCIDLVNTGIGADVAKGCTSVTVPPGAPIGNVESYASAPSSGGQPGTISVTGWALDPDTTAPIGVLVNIDGATTTWTADVSRADVAAAYPASGPNHGFAGTVPASPGRHSVCLWAINVPSSPGNPWLGCGTVTVT
jgi:SpoIID/LytB domain protein